jgi:hypothetical protein
MMPKVQLSKIDPDDRHNRPDVSKDAHQHFLRIASRAKSRSVTADSAGGTMRHCSKPSYPSFHRSRAAQELFVSSSVVPNRFPA